MTITDDQLRAYAELFPANLRFHGRMTNLRPETNEAGVLVKMKGTVVTDLSGPATIEDLRRHLLGEITIGLCPRRDDGSCAFGAIDVDLKGDQDADFMRRLLSRAAGL